MSSDLNFMTEDRKCGQNEGEANNEFHAPPIAFWVGRYLEKINTVRAIVQPNKRRDHRVTLEQVKRCVDTFRHDPQNS